MLICLLFQLNNGGLFQFPFNIHKTSLFSYITDLFSCKNIHDLKGYCVHKDNCTDPTPKLDQDTKKCKKEKKPGFNTCCITMLPITKCVLWQNRTAENTNTNKTKIEIIKNAEIFNNENCGISSVTGLNRIAFGNKTQIAEYPWMAMLNYKALKLEDSIFACGGSLISDKIVRIS